MPPRIPSSPAMTRPACAPRPICHASRPGPPTCKAAFSTTSRRGGFAAPRRKFIQWLRSSEAKSLRSPNPPGMTNYLEKNRPFPLNPDFVSTPVLDDASRELIWERVVRDGETIKAVSAEMAVDLRRVSAIVRLKQVEKDWLAKGRKLAKPYQNAVLSMLPTMTLSRDKSHPPFEPVNEVHVHLLTQNQLFWPTSESRHFTRADAAQAFHEEMLPTDERVPHPELVQMWRNVQGGMPADQSWNVFREAAAESARKVLEEKERKAQLEERYTTRVDTKRFEFRFKQINAENVGPKGRRRSAVGWKYGAPLDDRKRGKIKIPTSVP